MPEPAFLRRKALRHPAFDYTSAGYYFVTVCTADRICWLAAVHDGVLEPNEAGTSVHAAWNATINRLPGVALDAFVVMPNHVHAIVVLGYTGNKGVMNAAPTPEAYFPGARIGLVGAQFIAPLDAPGGTSAADIHAPLGEVVRRLKAASALAVRKAVVNTFGWQRGYFEHVIRDERTLDRVREYIADNPRKWAEDPENPERRR